MPRTRAVLRTVNFVLALLLTPSLTLAAAAPEKPAAAKPVAPAVPGPDLVAANPGGSAVVVAVISYENLAGHQVQERLAAFAKQNPGIKVLIRPTSGGGPLSEFLAKAAYTAARQGKFLAFHDAAVAAPQAYTWHSLRDSAPILGLDWARFQSDFMDPAVVDAVRANAEFAKERGIAAPPAFVAGGQVFAGPWAILDLRAVAAAAK